MKYISKKIPLIALAITSTMNMHAFLNIYKTTQNTVYNCQTADIIVNIKGDQNVAVIVSNCIFIAGAASPEKRLDTTGFTKLEASQVRTVPFATITKGIEFSPTESPQKGYTIQLIAFIDPVDKLPSQIRDEYKKQGITHGLQIWRAAKFKSSLVGSTMPSTQSAFKLLQTFPANIQQENDMVTVFPNGEVIFDNDIGTITIPAGPVR
jgi:hypothetical protein